MSNNVFAISNNINQILPFYPELISGEVTDVIPKMQALAQAGNMYANYVLGIYLIFGKVPRHYKFHKSYPHGFVKQNALINISEQLGLSYLIQLLKIKGSQVESYHLKGIYDLFKIVEGKAPFFENNDIECRPTETDYLQLKKLFDAPDQIRNILVRLDYYEIYLDYAKHKLEQFKNSNDEGDFKTALEYLNKIVEKSEFNQFNVFDISEAHYLLGKIYLFGNQYHKRNAETGIRHIEASRLDRAYVALLQFYKGFGEQYIKSIRKCISMINDSDLRLKLMQENGFPLPVPVNISDILRKLHFSPAIENIEPILKIEATPVHTEEDIYEEKLKEDAALLDSKKIAEDFDPASLMGSVTDETNSDEVDNDEMIHVEKDEHPDFIADYDFELHQFEDEDEDEHHEYDGM